MKGTSAQAALGRLLTFEVGGSAYAVPIADVAEVSTVGPVACIPTVPLRLGGVVNHHGDALAVMARSVLFDVEEDELAPPAQLLVLARRSGDGGCALGVPVDRILGLVPGRPGLARDPTGAGERHSIGGRVVRALDGQGLIERAARAIERVAAGPVAKQGGEE